MLRVIQFGFPVAIGSMPLLMIASRAAAEPRYLISSMLASGSLAPVAMPAETVRRLAYISSHVSQIDNDVAGRLRAADEEVAVSGLFEWLRSVGDRSRNQTALAVVTNSGPARPADRDVACLG